MGNQPGKNNGSKRSTVPNDPNSPLHRVPSLVHLPPSALSINTMTTTQTSPTTTTSTEESINQQQILERLATFATWSRDDWKKAERAADNIDRLVHLMDSTHLQHIQQPPPLATPSNDTTLHAPGTMSWSPTPSGSSEEEDEDDETGPRSRLRSHTAPHTPIPTNNYPQYAHGPSPRPPSTAPRSPTTSHLGIPSPTPAPAPAPVASAPTISSSSSQRPRSHHHSHHAEVKRQKHLQMLAALREAELLRTIANLEADRAALRKVIQTYNMGIPRQPEVPKTLFAKRTTRSASAEIQSFEAQIRKGSRATRHQSTSNVTPMSPSHITSPTRANDDMSVQARKDGEVTQLPPRASTPVEDASTNQGEQPCTLTLDAAPPPIPILQPIPVHPSLTSIDEGSKLPPTHPLLSDAPSCVLEHAARGMIIPPAEDIHTIESVPLYPFPSPGMIGSPSPTAVPTSITMSPRSAQNGGKAAVRLLRANKEHCEYQFLEDGIIDYNMKSKNLVRLVWADRPKTALLIKKPGDVLIARAMHEMADWLHSIGMTVMVEPAVKREEAMSTLHFLETWKGQEELKNLHKRVDFIICLGGDGTLLWVSNLFRTAVPPVISFAMGTLGFLTPFSLDNFRESLTRVFSGGFYITLRSRLLCTIVRAPRDEQHNEAQYEPAPPIDPRDIDSYPRSMALNTKVAPDCYPRRSSAEMMSTAAMQAATNVAIQTAHGQMTSPDHTAPSASTSELPKLPTSSITSATSTSTATLPDSEAPESFVCMNEVIIDRGPSSYLTNLDCSVDGLFFTKVQADGIIIGTPTGSTAYSLSAGGTMVHPEVPCLLFTPVCPHSLSFRPLLFPDSSTLEIQVSHESRVSNCASFDGRNRTVLNKGDSLLITMSRWPIPGVCHIDETTDWFDGVRGVLKWNSRWTQKPFATNSHPR